MSPHPCTFAGVAGCPLGGDVFFGRIGHGASFPFGVVSPQQTGISARGQGPA
jgi:hypothetical protein